MTIGQRIAQQRKEIGLSQEALGKELEVSRQSIYKWESDSALPEIDKLISLSRLFGVSVGWLLGVEEPSSPHAADVAPGELTEAQLKMVQEIVDRYLAAQPKPPKRKKWPWVLAVLLLVYISFSLFGQLDQLNSQYRNLNNSVSNIRYDVDAQINGISTRVEEILKAQNHLTAEYGTDIAASDLGRNTITFTMHSVPKTYTEGMTAVFVADCGDGPAEFPAELAPGHTFTCEATVPLTDSITLSVVFIAADGTRQTQVLDTYDGLYSASFPEVYVQEYHLFGTEVPDGTLTLSETYVTTQVSSAAKYVGHEVDAGSVQELKVGIFRNQTLLAWAEPCEKPESFQGFEERDFYRLPDMTIEHLTSDDVLQVASLVTDTFGRQFMACEVPYVISTDTDFDTPYLTYPADGRYETDPACWTF